MAHKLLEVFQSSSLEKFNKVFENLELMIKIDESHAKNYTPNKILSLADEIYADFAELWPHDAKSVGSTFLSDSDPMAKYDCWNCGQKGHLSRDCPTKKGSGSGGRGYGGRGYGRGGGRFGGRYGGRGSGRSTENQGGEKSSSPWYKKPPGKGEPHEIMKDGRKYFWCGKQECSNWNTRHGTATHTDRTNTAESEPPAAEVDSKAKKPSFSQAISQAVTGGKGPGR